MHRCILHNDRILDSREASICAGQVGFLNGWGVFSTIRVADGVLFAFERHWERMQHDARLMRVPFPSDPGWLRSRLRKLIEANAAGNATLRVAVVRNRGGLFEAPDQDRDFDVVAFTANLNDWGSTVRLTLKPNARFAENEFAGAKILSWAQNLTWYEEAHQRGFDEALLLNERAEVSECTSANVFAVFGDEIRTPPLSSGCLAGVTRALLLEEIRVPGLTTVETTLLPAQLEAADQVFVTSTTRDFLPVSEIEGLKVRNERLALIHEIGDAFDAYRHAYVQKMRSVDDQKITA